MSDIPPARKAKPTIDYEASGRTAARRTTLLLILTLLNTALLLSQYLRPLLAEARQWMVSRSPSAAPSQAAVPPAAIVTQDETSTAPETPELPPEKIAEGQKRLMDFILPEQTIVYTEVPQEIDDLQKRPQYAAFSVDTECERLGIQLPFTWSPPMYRKLGAGHILDDVTRSGVIFCHRLTSPSGYQRLVVVWIEPKMVWEVGGNGAVLSNRPTFKLEVLFPPVGKAPCRSIGTQDFGSKAYDSVGIDYLQGTPKLRTNPARYLRVLAAQPDADDPSRFTIHGTLGDANFEMTGKLNDNDRIDLSPFIGDFWPSTSRSGGRD